MKGKIVELQGLRCIAIVSVIVYHVWPNVFGNGFLGVDIFFVISGYIMARILLSSDSLKTSFFTTSFNFYYRRIYRILPLYLLNIAATILIIPTVSYSSSIDGIFWPVIHALTFTKNYSNLSKLVNYFDNFVSIDMFTHCWSLCVEMQFYVLVPFLLYVGKLLPLLVNLYVFWPALLIASIALVVYQLVNFGAFGTLYIFNMLPARLYEFFAGFIAYYAQEFVIEYFSDGKVKLEIRKYFHHTITLNCLTLILIGIVFWPIKSEDFLSVPVTIGITAGTIVVTAAIITFIGKEVKSDTELQYSFLAQDIFVFIGNASYALYIFHWIFIIILKARLEENQQNRQIIFILCFITGSLIHQYIEKPICKARLPWKTFFIWISISYAVICLAAYLDNDYRIPSADTKDLYHNQSKQITDSTEWKNLASSISPDISAELGVYSGHINCNHYSRKDWPHNPFPGPLWTYSNEFEGTGNLSVLIIGNSHAECETPGIKLAMEGLYSNLSFVAIPGITPFEGFQSSGPGWIILRHAVTHYTPDIIFLTFKYQLDFEDSSTDTDFHTMKVQEMITFLSNHSKAVFITGPQAHFDKPKFYSIKFTELIFNHGWVNDFGISQEEIDRRHVISAKRWNAIKCENCIFIDRLQAFCKNGWCSPLDETRKVPLFWDSDHVTAFGAHLLTKSIKVHFNQMFQLLQY